MFRRRLLMCSMSSSGEVPIPYADEWVQLTDAGTRFWSAALVGDGDQVFFADREGGYIYRSTDRGMTWIPLTNAGARNWNVSCKDKQGAIYFGDYDGNVANGYVYKSTDNGSTWTPLTAAGRRYWNAMHCAANGSLYFAAYLGYIYKSTNGGSTWTALTGAGSSTWRTITSDPSGNIYAAAYDSYPKKSTDGGSTWTPLTAAGARKWSPCAITTDNGTIILPVYLGGLCKSTDAGNSWTYTGGPYSSKVYIQSCKDIKGTVYLAQLYSGHVAYSEDNGATWNLLKVDSSKYGDISGFGAVCVDSKGFVYQGHHTQTSNGYIYRSPKRF